MSEGAEQPHDRHMTKAEKRQVRKSLEQLIQDETQIIDVFTVTITGDQQEQQDLMEVFSTPHITATAQKLSLRAEHAYDIKMGCDLRSPAARARVMETIKKKKPRMVVVCPPCGPFSTLQRLRKNRGEVYQQAKREAIELLEFAMDICAHQHAHGHKFVFEHPWLAEPWQQPAVQRVLQLSGVTKVQLHQCMFGLKDVSSRIPHKKPTGIITNCEEVAKRVQRLCDGSHDHEPIFGTVYTADGWKKRSELAQRYPKGLVNAIIAGYLEYHDNLMKQTVESSVFAVEAFNQEKDPSKITQILKRCHENLRHPSNQRLISMLRSA